MSFPRSKVAFGGIQAEGSKFVEPQSIRAGSLSRNGRGSRGNPEEVAWLCVLSLEVPPLIQVRTH